MKKLLHHFFIPSELNNYRAKVLHIDFLSYSLFLIIALFTLYKATPLSHILGIATDMSLSRLYELTNEKRTQNGLTPLSNNGTLAAAACQKAGDMLTKNYWAHFGPNGESPWNFIKSAGYGYEFAGENLCKNFMNSEGCVNAWMESPSHRENMLKGVYKDVGFCVMNGNLGGEDTTLVVQMFGTPPSGGIRVAEAQAAPAQQPNPQPTSQNPQPTSNFQQPTAAPTATPTPKKPLSTPPIIANTKNPPTQLVASSNSKPRVNLARFSFDASALFLSILLIAFIFDFYYAYKLKLIRLTGKHLAHFVFLGVMLISLVIIQQGAIL